MGFSPRYLVFTVCTYIMYLPKQSSEVVIPHIFFFLKRESDSLGIQKLVQCLIIYDWKTLFLIITLHYLIYLGILPNLNINLHTHTLPLPSPLHTLQIYFPTSPGQRRNRHRLPSLLLDINSFP